MNKDKYESIVFEHDFQKKSLDKAFEIVKKFIIQNKRILVGGMAIDFALRLKKSKLYPDYKLPDYDILSPDFHIDAYTIGDQLAEAGLQRISVIRALHPSTMRVRVNFVTVIDIGYVPKNIYDLIPTMTYESFTFVHPIYQMIDQHRALSLPYENPPLETIMNRWKKDMTRNDLLMNEYKDSLLREIPYGKTQSYQIPIEWCNGSCIAGIAGLVYWINEAIELGYRHNKLNFTMDKKFINVDLPENEPFVILTDDYEKIIPHMNGNISYYNAVLDKIPRCVKIESGNLIYQIIDNRGKFTSAHKVDKLFVANLQTIMCYLLTNAILMNNKTCLYWYTKAVDLIHWAGDQESKSDLISSDYQQFLPTEEIYGSYNWSEAYMLLLNQQNPKSDESDEQTPKNAYPSHGKPIKEKLYDFRPEKSNIYQFDGLAVGKFKPIELV